MRADKADLVVTGRVDLATLRERPGMTGAYSKEYITNLTVHCVLKNNQDVKVFVTHTTCIALYGFSHSVAMNKHINITNRHKHILHNCFLVIASLIPIAIRKPSVVIISMPRSQLVASTSCIL